ncbi:hypothetical protein ABT160_45385 [Streptomyces sp. NPDC001941]
MHVRELAHPAGRGGQGTLSVGDAIEVVVTDVDRERHKLSVVQQCS